MEEIAEVDLAAKLGEELGSAVFGSMVGDGYGRLMSLIPGNDSSNATDNKLGLIIDELEIIKSTLKHLIVEINTLFEQAKYEIIAAGIKDLTSRNETLLKLLGDAAASKKDGNKKSFKGALSEIRRLDSTTLTAPTDWHAMLCEGPHGGEGALKAWNRLVRANAGNFFGTEAARAILSHWKYLDAQQALSVMFAVELKNADGNTVGAQHEVVVWGENRAIQRNLLRGLSDGADDFTQLDKEGNKVPSRPSLNVLPPRTVIATVGDRNIMYSLDIAGPIRRGDGDDRDFHPQIEAIKKAGGLAHFGADDPTSEWQMAGSDDLIQFLKLCGGRVADGGETDIFAEKLRDKGFTYPDGQLRLWSDKPALFLLRQPVVFVDGETWWSSIRDPNTTAYVLLQRTISAEEQQRYWY